MKYNLPRPLHKQTNISDIIERELVRQDSPLEYISKKSMQELADVVKSIQKKGLPDYLVLKKVSDEVGHGIFLHPKAAPLKKGAVIGSYSGELAIEVENKEDDSAYAFAVLGGLILKKAEQARLDKGKKFAPNRRYALNLDANHKGNFTRFINHCESPNVEAIILSVPKNRFGLEERPIEVVYFAKKTINPGEQLLVCYEDEDETYWSAFGTKPVKMTPKTYQLDAKLNLIQP